MASRPPQFPGPADQGKSAEYRLLLQAQQQVDQLQVFAARLQQQILSLQGQLDVSERKGEETAYASDRHARRADALRRVLARLRERLERLEGQALRRLVGRVAALEQAHDAEVQRGLPADGRPDEASGPLEAEDPFAGLEAEEAAPAPAASPEPVPLVRLSAPAPAVPVAPAEPAAATELARLRGQRLAACGIAALASIAACLFAWRGRAPASLPVAPPALAVAASSQEPGPSLTVGEQALRIAREHPAGRGGTLSRRLAALTHPGTAEAEPWAVGACEGSVCDVSYRAGIVDPETGKSLVYLFRVEVSRGDVRGLNPPALVILR